MALTRLEKTSLQLRGSDMTIRGPHKANNLFQSPITMYYDDACIICSTEAHDMQSRNPAGIHLMPVEKGLEALSAAGFSRMAAMTYLCVQDGSGHWYTHMDAVRLLYKTAKVPWAKWLYLPVVKQLGDFAYPFVARNRYGIPNWVTKLIYGEAMTVVKEGCKSSECQLATKQHKVKQN